MKIGLVNYEYSGLTENCGGGGQVTRWLKEGLELRGHSVRVVTDNGWDPSDGAIRGPRPAGHYVTFPFRAYKHTKNIVEWADVVNGHFSVPSSLFLPLLCRRHDTPLTISVMGADVHDPVRFGWLRPCISRINRRLFEASERVIAPSMALAQYMTPGDYDCRVIPYGINPSEWGGPRADGGTATGRWRILTVCRLVERKNLHVAIDAVARLRDRLYTPVEYTIVGTGPLYDELDDKYGDEPWLSLPGYVDDLQAEYDSHDVFFLPTEFEAFGIVFLEALASGLPVVTSNTGAQSEIIDPSVGWAQGDPDDTDTFVDGLETVLGDYRSYQRATGGYLSENYHVDRMVADYEAEFEALA